MSLYRDEGIVLRTQKLGEADRIVTLLTRRTGRVRAAAKGVRKTKSRFGARLEPFTHVDVQFYERRSLDLITQAETIRPYGQSLAIDYPRYTAGVAMLETAEKLTAEEKEPALRQFLLLVGGLRTLGEGTHDPRLVLDAYLLRSLSVAGWAPALDECSRCGVRGGLKGFAIPAGGAVCGNCRQPGAATPQPPTFDLMLALLRGEWGIADESEGRHRIECSGLVAAYLQWHLEHGIRSLKHVERAEATGHRTPTAEGRAASEEGSPPAEGRAASDEGRTSDVEGRMSSVEGRTPSVGAPADGDCQSGVGGHLPTVEGHAPAAGGRPSPPEGGPPVDGGRGPDAGGWSSLAEGHEGGGRVRASEEAVADRENV